MGGHPNAGEDRPAEAGVQERQTTVRMRVRTRMPSPSWARMYRESTRRAPLYSATTATGAWLRVLGEEMTRHVFALVCAMAIPAAASDPSPREIVGATEPPSC